MPATPIRAVILDFHNTLFAGHSTSAWVEQAWGNLGRPGHPRHAWPDEEYHTALHRLGDIWTWAHRRDPQSRRDLSPETHRQVFIATATEDLGIDPDLAGELYRLLPDQWTPFRDTAPLLRHLAGAGVRTAILSNIGIDIRPRLRAERVLELVHTVVLSFEVAVVKPDPAIFDLTLQRLGADPEETLMVGDSWRDDGGATALGIRTLLLPPVTGPTRGLELVERLVR